MIRSTTSNRRRFLSIAKASTFTTSTVRRTLTSRCGTQRRVLGKDRRLGEALKRQVDRLAQLACQYLHAEKVELAARLAQYCEKRFGVKGRVQFNVGGSQAIEDSLKLVRNYTGKSLMFAFMGGYHGRTLGASAITSSFRYRRRYGHFGERAQFIFYPYCFRCIYGLKRESCGLYCHDQFAKLFENEYRGVWDAKRRAPNTERFISKP